MLSTSIKEKTEYDMTFGLLAGLAIVMVAAGHLGYGVLTMGDLFPYYSFHVPLFMFISGYFYKQTAQERPAVYVRKKVRRLLAPYLVWNLIYGLIAWLMRANGFAMGEEIGLRTLFLAPFLHGYQFIYNYAAWFVPVLFVIEMMNLLMRLAGGWIFRRRRNRRGEAETMTKSSKRESEPEPAEPGGLEWLYLAGSLAVGMAVVYLAIGGHVWGSYKAPGRILFLYPCFQMGQFYKKKLEKHDTLPNLSYFAILIGIQVLLQTTCNGLAFSSVWCTGFGNGPVIPYVTIVSGVAFWLRIARIAAPLVGKNGVVRYVGQHTFTVMMHHVMVFMLVKMVLAGIAAGTGKCADFDFAQFYSNIDYIYLVNGAEHFKMVYLAAGLAAPLGVRYFIERAAQKRREAKGESSG